MLRPAWKWFRVFAFVAIVALVGYQCVHAYRWREQADFASGVALELRPIQQKIKVGESPTFQATVVNRGRQSVVLVQPGDGSESGYRTPGIAWSLSGWFRVRMCGNINALKAAEVFSLRSGEAQNLSDWVGHPRLRGRGSYHVALRYTNDPDQPFLGLPFGPHDEEAMKALRGSTKVSIVSNEVEVVVEE